MDILRLNASQRIQILNLIGETIILTLIDHSERSVDEDDIREAVSNLRVDDNSDLSEEDDFVYAVDEADVEAHGYRYAKYKARIMEELDEDDDSLSEYSGEYVYKEPDEGNDSNRESDGC